MKVREIIKLLNADGWSLGRAALTASFKHPTKPRLVTVSGKLSKDIPRGTLNSILKQAGLKGDAQDDEP